MSRHPGPSLLVWCERKSTREIRTAPSLRLSSRPRRQRSAGTVASSSVGADSITATYSGLAASRDRVLPPCADGREGGHHRQTGCLRRSVRCGPAVGLHGAVIVLVRRPARRRAPCCSLRTAVPSRDLLANRSTLPREGKLSHQQLHTLIRGSIQVTVCWPQFKAPSPNPSNPS